MHRPPADAVTDTFEYRLDEWNVGRFAASLGKEDDVPRYQELSQSDKNLFHPRQAWTYDAAGTDAARWSGAA